MTSTKDVFGPIALSLSGGGYRAAAFHLGALIFLDEVKLREKVNYLSTVSGGSIVGGYYAACLSDSANFKFSDFRSNFEKFLTEVNVVKEALKKLPEEAGPGSVKQMPSLIRAAAEVYNGKWLLNGKTFGDVDRDRGHLEEVVINSTEFRSSGSFRFVSSSNPKVVSGRNGFEFERETSAKVRLADAVAASSCFPSGFEPIRFPSDFVWPDPKVLDALRHEQLDDPNVDIPLMDGGIFDNQGIDSIGNIFDRVKTDIDLFIISDTSARNSKPYSFENKDRTSGWSIGVWTKLIWLLWIVSVICTLFLFTQHGPFSVFDELGVLRGVLTFYLPLVVLLTVDFGIPYGSLKLRGLLEYAREKTGIRIMDYLKRLSVMQIVHLVRGRMESLIEMSTNTFMTRIRLMAYSYAFSDPKISEKLLPNIIYDIDNEERWRAIGKDAALRPKENIRTRVKRAESYETNLWFLESSDLENLIFCGQATMCFKLLKFLIEKRPKQILTAGSPEKLFYDELVDHWSKFNV